MDSDLKLIGILSLFVLILGNVFTLRPTILNDVEISSANAKLTTANILISETDINSISTTDKYLNTINTLDITNGKNELLEHEEIVERTNKVSKEFQKYEKKQVIFSSLSSLIIALIILFVLYCIFEKYSFATGLIVYSMYAIISSCIQNGFSFSSIFLSFIVALIETIITYVVYTKSNSFRNFLGKLLLVGMVIVIIIVILGTVIAIINGNNGILSKAQ